MKIPNPKKLKGLTKTSIKGCPFCTGERVVMGKRWSHERLRPIWTYVIRCSSCAATGGWAQTPGNALRNWNMRSFLYGFATLEEEPENE